MKQDIRLIAMDLDGTALNSKKELTGRTRDAIEQAVKQGIHVVVAEHFLLWHLLFWN